ncbi:MAG: glycosyltransferase family 8 protein [Bacteroidetes bacterium]|nr:glycosyltransferase family 8 protein [Bacteroidota bacterium]MBU1371692.1 glycosyltransferase family 8 protein [Bacteroidota bacterium]MBU1484133.1 glycosyltransferase family 8 protein [Bacteroidota bacterium]MBU1761629.1 glycosyltransferase family 8 protein [Bacteroidota bacterium]MBU2267362.1 glycosyltransferase family 8 protein [Bacteroidota bacterium]
MENTIYLASNCDNDYILFYATLLKSIEIHHKTSEKIVSFLIGDNISEENKAKVEQSLTLNKIEIRWMTCADFIPEGYSLPNDRSTFPISIYMNIYLPRGLAPEIKKILYLDVDMIVLDDISKLYNLDLGDNILAAALDRIKIFSHWAGILNYKELGFDPNLPYFNTGVMLIDAEKWRANQVTQAIIDAIENNKKYSFFADQYGLNVVLAKLPWLVLPQKWNHVSFDPIEKTQPSIIHYVAEKPIHEHYKALPEHAVTFFKYLEKTKFKDAQKISSFQWKLKRLKIIISKRFRRIFNNFDV